MIATGFWCASRSISSIFFRPALRVGPNLLWTASFLHRGPFAIVNGRRWAVVATIDAANANASNASPPLTPSVATPSVSATQSGRARDSSPAITHSGFRHCANDAAVAKRCPLMLCRYPCWALCGFTLVGWTSSVLCSGAKGKDEAKRARKWLEQMALLSVSTIGTVAV